MFESRPDKSIIRQPSNSLWALQKDIEHSSAVCSRLMHHLRFLLEQLSRLCRVPAPLKESGGAGPISSHVNPTCSTHLHVQQDGSLWRGIPRPQRREERPHCVLERMPLLTAVLSTFTFLFLTCGPWIASATTRETCSPTSLRWPIIGLWSKDVPQVQKPSSNPHLYIDFQQFGEV